MRRNGSCAFHATDETERMRWCQTSLPATDGFQWNVWHLASFAEFNDASPGAHDTRAPGDTERHKRKRVSLGFFFFFSVLLNHFRLWKGREMEAKSHTRRHPADGDCSMHAVLFKIFKRTSSWFFMMTNGWYRESETTSEIGELSYYPIWVQQHPAISVPPVP